MNRNSFTEPCKVATLGGAFVWLAVGCGGTTGREGIARAIAGDASADSSLDDMAEPDGIEGDAVDESRHRRRDGGQLSADGAEGDDASLSTDAANEHASASTCGNGTVEMGEECDDGNKDETDGCTNVCTDEKECDECVIASECAVGAFPACSTVQGVAADGPSKGFDRNQLCLELYDCVESHGCARGASWTTCYCGDSNPSACFTTPGVANGPCHVETESAAETTLPSLVQARFLLYTRPNNPMVVPFGVGAVMKIMACRLQECRPQCVEAKTDAGR